MKALTQQQVDFFRHNGFLFPVPALSPAEIRTCLDGLARLEADLGCAIADADTMQETRARIRIRMRTV